MNINQPSNQIKLTNVSIVRLKKGGKRFEIACYKNKVLEYRSRVEKDLDNVLQIHQVFMNVSKGQVASKEDLKVFKTDKLNDILSEILERGELQVGEKERSQVLENLTKDIYNIVSEMTVNPDSKRPYTFSMIEKAASELHYSVSNKSAKSQALDVIRALQEAKIIPIERAQMRVRVKAPTKDAKKYGLKDSFASIESEDVDDTTELVGWIDPGQFKVLSDAILLTKGKGTIEVLTLKQVSLADEKL